VDVKRASDVGRDFDKYAEKWAEQGYHLEVRYTGEGVERDETSGAVRWPGDEWGDGAVLRRQYQGLVARLGLPETVNVLEIGAGGGRSTAALLDVLGARAGRYHVIDVADGFVNTLRQRVQRELDIHIVSDVDVSMVPDGSIDLVLAQSSWSHINLYDQYRYLRDVRNVLRPGAPIVVSGLFVLGLADDWTWNRFRRRVHQVDRDIQGVYHEFTSVGALSEMLTRLGYQEITVFPHGFTARRGRLGADQHTAKLPEGFGYGYAADFEGWAGTGRALTTTLPPGATGPRPARPGAKQVTGLRLVRRRVRRVVGRLGGRRVRDLVRSLRG
jgi:SAM-dependent methyltransferase